MRYNIDSGDIESRPVPDDGLSSYVYNSLLEIRFLEPGGDLDLRLLLRKEVREAVDAVLKVAIAVEIVDVLLDQDGQVGGADRENGLAVALPKKAANRVLADLLKFRICVIRALPEPAGCVAGPPHADQPFRIRTCL